MKMKYKGDRAKSLITRNIGTGNKAKTRINFRNPEKAALRLKKLEEDEIIPEEWF